MKKLKDILFESDEYDGLTWFDVIVNCVFISGTFIGLAFLINAVC